MCMNCMSDSTAGTWSARIAASGRMKPQSGMRFLFRRGCKAAIWLARAKKSNGEGITYIGYDTVLNISGVELREFFPQTLVRRRAGARAFG